MCELERRLARGSIYIDGSRWAVTITRVNGSRWAVTITRLNGLLRAVTSQLTCN